MLVQDPIMSLDLPPVAVHGIRQLFGGRVLEMHGLTRKRANSGSDEEEPRQKLRSIRRSSDEAARLFAEVKQDRARIEHPRLAPARPLVIDDRRNLAVRIDGAKGVRVLLALGRIDRNRLVRLAKLFEHQRDLHRIGREVEIEADHGALQINSRPLRGAARAVGGRLGIPTCKTKTNFRWSGRRPVFARSEATRRSRATTEYLGLLYRFARDDGSLRPIARGIRRA